MTDTLDELEKKRKPEMSKKDCIENLCTLNGYRTDLLIEAMKTGVTDSIKNSQDPESEKKKLYLLVNSKASDRLHEDRNVNELELSFASRHYKADQEPTYQN